MFSFFTWGKTGILSVVLITNICRLTRTERSTCLLCAWSPWILFPTVGLSPFYCVQTYLTEQSNRMTSDDRCLASLFAKHSTVTSTRLRVWSFLLWWNPVCKNTDKWPIKHERQIASVVRFHCTGKKIFTVTSDGTIYRIVSNIAILRSYRGISLSR